VGWRNVWPANQPGRYRSLGPRDVNFDHYPSWYGYERIVVMSPDVYRAILSALTSQRALFCPC
jgi:hypothetical protein